jgi:hypothetical protein
MRLRPVLERHVRSYVEHDVALHVGGSVGRPSETLQDRRRGRSAAFLEALVGPEPIGQADVMEDGGDEDLLRVEVDAVRAADQERAER